MNKERKDIKALWIDPSTGSPLEDHKMTALVATTIQSLFPLSNIRPIDIRRYFASSILSNRMTLPEENVNSTIQAWAKICNTSVEMAEIFTTVKQMKRILERH